MEILTNNYFYNKKVLITGACGFIGSHLVKRLLSEKAKVFIIMKSTSNPWRIKAELHKVSINYTDIRDEAEVDMCIKAIKPDYVFHLAAYGVDSAQKVYSVAANINIIGIINILNSLKDIGLERFINIGSCAEYGDRMEIISEDSCLAPVSIYGSTKACATILAHQIANENHINIVTLRPFGIFGESEERHKIFCHVIMSILENKDVNLTLCEQYRDYCYVENIIDGMLMAAESKKVKNEIFNIGSGESHPLSYYIELIFKNIATEKKPNYGAIEYRKNEMWNPRPNISKIQSILNWEPRVALEDGILNTINWFKENKHSYL